MAHRKWEKPQLIVLVKGKPEESVLVNCKTQTISGTGHLNHAYDQCCGNRAIFCTSGGTGNDYCSVGTGGGTSSNCPYSLCNALGRS